MEIGRSPILMFAPRLCWIVLESDVLDLELLVEQS